MKNKKTWTRIVTSRIKNVKLRESSFSFSGSNFLIRFVLIFLLFGYSNFSFSQNADSTKIPNNFGVFTTVTNNGISFIPTFSLGKPAVIFDLSIGRKLTFEPQFRFSLEGKPWSFLFWWRYKLISNDRFLVKVGAHPALSFKTITSNINGISKETITATRYLAGELAPNYLLTKNMSIGMYYLYSRCLDKEGAQNTHFLTLNSNFSNIKLVNTIYMKFTPQVYYLKMDNYDGFYFTSALSFSKKDFPLSLSFIMNKIIKTDITASKNFVWSASLIYAFNKKYIEQ